MGTTIAFVAECQGSASLAEQTACLQPSDRVVTAGRHSFNKLEDLLTKHGMKLAAGDRVKVYDLSCITLSTPTLIRLLAKMLRTGVTFEIVSLGIVIAPNAADKLHVLIDALDSHHRHVHGVKTHRASAASRGRKRLLEPEKLDEIRAKLDAPGATATDVALELGVARSTLFNFLERYDRERRPARDKQIVEGRSEDDGDRGHVVERELGERSS